ncbi:MAG: hypothetical protein AAGE52_14935 [Myxococcota bacterium]
MTPQTYSVEINGQRRVWYVSRLWSLSRELPVTQYPITSFAGLDHDLWFCGVHAPTVRAVLAHMDRIERADLTFPILLSAEGFVMDGVHRICKAHRLGRVTLPATQFCEDPPPDQIIDLR